MAASSQIVGAAGPFAGPRAFLRRLRSGDEIAHLLTLCFAASVVLVTSLLVYKLWASSTLARHKFGWHFLFTSVWDPIAEQFAPLPFIYGTLWTSPLGLL